MKRVVLISDFARVRGGASALAVLLAETLARRGRDVTLFAGDAAPPSEGTYKVIALGGDQLLAGGAVSALRGLWNRGAHRALQTLIARSDTPDTVYHVHGFLQTLSPSVLAALHPVRARTVIHAHDYFLACPNGAFFDYRAGRACPLTPLSPACLTRNCDKRSYAQKLWRLARQVLQNRVAAPIFRDGTVILLHAGMAPLLSRSHDFGRVEVIANPSAGALTPLVPAETNRRLMYLGDIHAYKGVYLFAEAARLAGITPEFIGEGQDRAKLAALYPEAVFHGWQSKEAVSRLLQKARALIAPTLGPEPFGLAIVEALRAGVPVIASDSVLLGASLRTARAGLTFTAGSAADLAAVLQTIAEDDDLVQGMSRRAPTAAAELALPSELWVDRIAAHYDTLPNGVARKGIARQWAGLRHVTTPPADR